MATLYNPTQSSALNRAIQSSGPATPVMAPKAGSPNLSLMTGSPVGGSPSFGPNIVERLTSSLGGGRGAVRSAADIQREKDEAEKGKLRGEVNLTADEINRVFDQLFAGLDALLRERAARVETDYGDQLEKTTKQYVDSLPAIESSYASLGAADSTDLRDANIGAKEGFDEATDTIKKNKSDDLAKIGQYGAGERARWTADRDSVNRIKGRVGEVDDLGELRQTRGSLEDRLGTARADVGTLITNKGAEKQLSDLTQDAGRFESATNALDAVLKSALSGDVKAAAKKAIVDSGGLTDEQKKKVDAQYGNTYAEQIKL